MAIWIQSLSWALIYGLGQGFVVYASLWLVLKLVPSLSANVKYHLSLSALTVLLAWFAATWWQQFHLLANEQSATANTLNALFFQQPIHVIDAIKGYDSYKSVLSFVILPWLSAVYFVGLALMVLRLLGGMLQLSSLRRNGISQPATKFTELLIALQEKLHFKGNVQLLISVKAQVPMVIGFLKPIILMPAAAMAQLSTEQLETILLHELAHIKRYDYLVNILQTVVETILFFNPFVWMVSAITRREREHCCDDLVMDHTREPLDYITALAALAANPETASTFAMAATGSSNHLFNRIQRIMETKRNQFSYSRMAAAILIITAIAGSIAWLSPSFGDPKKDKSAEAAAIAPEAPTANAAPANESDESQLIRRLMDDRLIDQVKGFVVEKKKDLLYINGTQVTNEIAGKYLQTIKTEEIRVQVYPFMERLKQHPDANLMQIIAPVSFKSGCVDYQPKKPGC